MPTVRIVDDNVIEFVDSNGDVVAREEYNESQSRLEFSDRDGNPLPAALGNVTAKAISVDSEASSGTDVVRKDEIEQKADLTADDGTVLPSQIPDLAITETFAVAGQSERLALTDVQTGDVAIQSDTNEAYIFTGGDSSSDADWSLLANSDSPVSTVFGRTGDIAAESGDYTASEIANFASAALSAVEAEIDATSASVAGLDDATNTHIGAGNPHSSSASTNHGNEAHSSAFAVDGDTQPPESHNNTAHSENYTTATEAADAAPVDDVFGRTGSVTPQSGDYSASDITNFASSALSAVEAEIDATSASVAGLDDATNTHIGAGNPHSSSASTNHGNEAHSSVFAVDGDTQPPENHDNTNHSVNFTVGDYEIQKNGTDGQGIINIKTN